jgi:hypothetical protein
MFTFSQPESITYTRCYFNKIRLEILQQKVSNSISCVVLQRAK